MKERQRESKSHNDTRCMTSNNFEGRALDATVMFCLCDKSDLY